MKNIKQLLLLFSTIIVFLVCMGLSYYIGKKDGYILGHQDGRLTATNEYKKSLHRILEIIINQNKHDAILLVNQEIKDLDK